MRAKLSAHSGEGGASARVALHSRAISWRRRMPVSARVGPSPSGQKEMSKSGSGRMMMRTPCGGGTRREWAGWQEGGGAGT